jgi:putative phage-type endonuclease
MAHIAFLKAQLSHLVNIMDDLKPEPLFSNTEVDELVESSMVLMDDYIKAFPLAFADPTHHLDMCRNVQVLLLAQFRGTDFENEDGLEEELESIVSYASKCVYTVVAPRRSYARTFIRREPNVKHMSQKIECVRAAPQPPQRTDEWHRFRYALLTASAIWKCFGSTRTRNQLIYEKCKPLDVSKYFSVQTESPLHHGTRFEPVSVQYYEMMFKTEIEDFGCIQHPLHHCIGASPDGINVDPTSPRYGRMLEIKNIVNREITGIPKFEYWIQMQLQMETCNLNECDFLETRFKEYESVEAYHQDGSFNVAADGKIKGIMLYFIVDGQPSYHYMPLGIDHSGFLKWEKDMMTLHPNDTWVRNIYWKLDEISCVLVLRNKVWFANAVHTISETWDMIVDGRANGYEQYAPRRSQKGGRTTEYKPESSAKKVCFINPQEVCLDDATQTECAMTIDTSEQPIEKDAYLSQVLNTDPQHNS